MFQDLDDTIQQMFDDPSIPAALNDLRNADVSFETPDRNYTPAQATVNLFLYEVKENRELRDPVPITVQVNGSTIVRRPPMRLDCSYLVTAWSSSTGATRIAEEHRLLGQSILWLSRFPTIPTIYLQGAMVRQIYPPLLSVVQVDPNRNAGDFWMAMGIPPRAAYYLTVTIDLDLNVETEAPLVTTTIAWYQQSDDPTSREEWITIGGLVLDPTGQPIPGVSVQLDPGGRRVDADGQGRFVFLKVHRGTGYTLHAGSSVLGQISRPVEIPSPTGEYNLRF